MKLLVTGGAGFMGSNFIHHILASSPDVEVVNFDKLTYAGNLDNVADLTSHPRYRFVRGDIADAAAVEQAFTAHRPQVVINYAAETHVDRSIFDSKAFIVTDVLGTYELLEASRRHGIERFIQISTDEVYGQVFEGSTPETARLDPRSPYAASKAGGDHLVRAFFETYGLPTILTRSCNFYGPHQYPEKLIPLFITNLIEGKKVPVYGDGKQVREWIFTEDHCRAIDTILHHGKAGETYNIGTGERRENIAVSRALLKSFGLGDEMIEHVADRAGHDFRYAPDATKLMSELGWAPRTHFEEGLAKTLTWYREHEAWWKRLKSEEYLKYYQQQYGSR